MLRQISPRTWHTLPILTDDAQRNLKPLTASWCPPIRALPIPAKHPDRAGGQFDISISKLASVASLGTKIVFASWDFDGDKAMAISLPGIATMHARRKARSKGLAPRLLGVAVHVDLSADTESGRVAEKRRPDYLTAHSFVLNEVARRAREQRLDLRLERIISIGTVLTDDNHKPAKKRSVRNRSISTARRRRVCSHPSARGAADFTSTQKRCSWKFSESHERPSLPGAAAGSWSTPLLQLRDAAHWLRDRRFCRRRTKAAEMSDQASNPRKSHGPLPQCVHLRRTGTRTIPVRACFAATPVCVFRTGSGG